MPSKPQAVEIEVDDKVVRVRNPDRVYFPETGATKLDLVEYYLSVGDGIVNALFERPCMLHRFPKGLAGDKVHQKRLPAQAPDLGRDGPSALPALEPDRRRALRHRARQRDLGGPDVDRRVPSLEQPPRGHREAGRVADRPRPRTVVGLGAGEASRPCRPRGSGRPRCGREPEDVEAGQACTSTSGIQPDHGHKEVRRAALAFAREVERRAPDDVTTLWWRKDRDPHHLFVDYNQNARDHTIAAAYSVRGVADARVSAPIHWEEIDAVTPADFTIDTLPARFKGLGDLHGGIDEQVFDVSALIEWADRDEREGAEPPADPD